MTTYLRKNNSYTAVSTYASSGRLSVGAIGLLTLILSNHDSFVIYKGALQRRSKVGTKLFKRFWKELEVNGFVYEIQSNYGRINYEYIIVNDPSHESSSEAIDQILESREHFSTDGELDAENDLLDIVDEQDSTNISLNNEDLNNIDLSNIDLSNSTLEMSETPKNIEETVQFWYKNVNDEMLSEQQLLILEDSLFTSTLSNIVSNLKSNINHILLIELKLSLINIFDLYRFVVNECEERGESYTGFYLANEILSTISIIQ
jgi:hypothetical protein